MPRFTLPVALLCAALLPTATLAQQDKFFDSNGVRLRYVEQGQGQPIVLLHGNGNTLQSWIDAGVFKNLAADFRVIAFDARGHGKSAKPHDPKQYGPEMARDVVRLLDHLSIPKAHIIGYSMGAGTILQLLTMNPERFLTAVLGASAGRFGPWTDANQREADLEASEREKECISRSQVIRLAPTSGPKPTEEDLQRLSKACFANPNQDRFALAAVARSRGANVVDRQRAAAVTVPTLGIVGTLDGNLARLQELKKLRPSLHLVIIEGAVHGSGDPRGAMRHPRFVAAIREFIAAQGKSTQP